MYHAQMNQCFVIMVPVRTMCKSMIPRFPASHACLRPLWRVQRRLGLFKAFRIAAIWGDIKWKWGGCWRTVSCLHLKLNKSWKSNKLGPAMMGLCLLLFFDPRSDQSSDDSTASDGETKTGEVALTINALHSLHVLDEASDVSTYATHGLDRARMKKLLRSPPCECQCRIPLGVLHRACSAFWKLPKQSQDACLWSIQCGKGRKSTWSIEGLTIFQSCHYLLFI